MKQLLTLLFMFLLTGTFVSCSDDEEEPAAIDPKTALIINKDWRCTADVVVSTNSAGVTTTIDRYASYQACQKDDFIRFNPDFTLLISEGPGRCQPNDPQTATVTWSWNADKTVITMVDPSLDSTNLPRELSGPADLTSNVLVVKQTYTKDGTNNVRTVTYGSI